MPKQLKWLSLGSAVLVVAMGLAWVVQVARAACGPNDLGEFCSPSFLLVGGPSAVNVPINNTPPTAPEVDQAQTLPSGPLLYVDYKVLEAEARTLLDRSVKFRQDISPYRQTNNFNKLVRQFDVNAGFSEPYDDPNAAIVTMTLQQRIDMADADLRNARNIYAVLAVYAPEVRMRTDTDYITATQPSFAAPLCGATTKENPNPPDPQFTGQVLDPIVDWCDFPARLRQAAREAAYLRMIFGQQFMVDALGLNFGSNLLGGEEYVKKEVAKLDAARNQFSLAQRGLNEALGYRLGSGCYLSDFYTQSEWALLSQAAELQMTAQHNMAVRQSYLSINVAADVAKAQDTAIDTYRTSSTEGYIKMIVFSGLSSTSSAAGSFCNAKGARPGNLITEDMAQNLLDTLDKARELKAGRNVFGFDVRFTPARTYRTAFGSTDKGLWEQAREAALLAADTQAQATAAGRAFDLNQQDLQKAILATNNKVDNEIQIEAGCDLKDFGTNPDPDGAWYACIEEMIKNTTECDPTQDSFDACMNRTTDGLPPKADGSNWLIVVSDMRTARQDLRVAWLGVKAAIQKRDNLIQRASIESWRNSRVTSLILTGAGATSAFEAAIAAANCCTIEYPSFGNPSGAYSFNPGAVVEAALRPAQIMAQAANDMKIEDANSEAAIRNFFLDVAEAQGEIDTAMQQYQSQLTQFNGVVGQTGHDVFQSKREHAYAKSLPANDPGYRMTRDSLRLLLASQLDLAARLSYLAARRAEFEFTARLSGSNFRISDIYKARNANDILDFLNRLDATVNNLPGAIKDAETNQSDLTISVAQHVLGLSDKLLQGEGFSGAGIQTERVKRFRQWVSGNTLIGSDGKPRLVFSYTLSADPKGILSSVLQQGFDYYWLHKVGGIGQPKPGSNGFGVNLVTAQTGELGFRQTRVSQTGQVNLTTFAGCQFDYRLIAPAVLLGLDFPNTQPSDEVSGLFNGDINGKHGNSAAGYSTPAFLGRPLASNGWQVTVFAGSPNGILPDLDLQQLNDIELKISTVHATRPSNTPPQSSACVRTDF
jgi:hypothetical protein